MRTTVLDRLKRLRALWLGPEPRRIPRVSAAELRSAFARLRPALEAEFIEIIARLQATPDVAYLLFDVWADAAFDEFPIRTEVFRRHGETPEGVAGLDGRVLLPGTTLLPAEDAYPLGRFDVIGADTTPDAALVERVCIDEFLRAWKSLARNVPGVRSLLGVWAPMLEFGGPFPLTDLETGDAVLLDVLWATGEVAPESRDAEFARQAQKGWT